MEAIQLVIHSHPYNLGRSELWNFAAHTEILQVGDFQNQPFFQFFFRFLEPYHHSIDFHYISHISFVFDVNSIGFPCACKHFHLSQSQIYENHAFHSQIRHNLKKRDQCSSKSFAFFAIFRNRYASVLLKYQKENNVFFVFGINIFLLFPHQLECSEGETGERFPDRQNIFLPHSTCKILIIAFLTIIKCYIRTPIEIL